jgi:biopolymer transport protein ExbB
MVMFPLLISSIAMWMMIINRFIVLKTLDARDIDREKAKECILNNKLPYMDKHNGLRAMFVIRFLKRRSGKSDLDRYILDETVMHMVSSMDRYLVYIGALAAVSPLFGLLGTVMGMMATFDIISMFGTGNAKAMAGGISEALISTQTGLLVAIPGLYMYNLLKRKADNLKRKIASTGYYLSRYI